MTADNDRETVETPHGGVYWSAKVFDEQTGEMFKLKANSDEIRVFPASEDFSISTFARFFEFVAENVDGRAIPVVPDE